MTQHAGCGRPQPSSAVSLLAGTRRLTGAQAPSAYGTAQVAALAALEERTDAEEQRRVGLDSEEGAAGTAPGETLLQVQHATEQLRKFMAAYGSAQTQQSPPSPDASVSLAVVSGFCACCLRPK